MRSTKPGTDGAYAPRDFCRSGLGSAETEGRLGPAALLPISSHQSEASNRRTENKAHPRPNCELKALSFNGVARFPTNAAQRTPCNGWTRRHMHQLRSPFGKYVYVSVPELLAKLCRRDTRLCFSPREMLLSNNKLEGDDAMAIRV